MNKVFFGDCRDTMRNLIAQGVKVQMCVTSPPYFGLRDYGHHGQLGLEATPAEFVAAMVEVFGLVRELLADDGVLWLNLGDSYNAAGRTGHGTRQGFKQGTNRASDTGADASGFALAVGARVKVLPSADTGGPAVRLWIGKKGTVSGKVGPKAWDVTFDAKVAKPITGKAAEAVQSFHVTELEVVE
jgi:hypothetical protein